MTLDEFFQHSYGWADVHAVTILLLLGVAFPIVGTVGAWIGRGGKTDSDGKLIASAIIGIAILLFMLEIATVLLAHMVYGRSVLDANAAVLATPVACLVLSIFGLRLVFPLNKLATVRTLADMIALGLACAASIWFFSKFRGWGIVFLGSFMQLVFVVVLGGFFLRRLYRRAFGLDSDDETGKADG
jgi:hypothetical protein